MLNRIDQVSRSRLRRRASPVILNAANSLLIPLLSPIVSLAVVRLAGAGLWGDLVGVLIVVQLVAHVVAWGNKEYLLRQFSFSPAHAAHAWQSSLATRLLLCVAPFGVAIPARRHVVRDGGRVLWLFAPADRATVWQMQTALPPRWRLVCAQATEDLDGEAEGICATMRTLAPATAP